MTSKLILDVHAVVYMTDDGRILVRVHLTADQAHRFVDYDFVKIWNEAK